MSDFINKAIKKLYRKAWKRNKSRTPKTPDDAREITKNYNKNTNDGLFYLEFTRDWLQCFVRARLASTLPHGDRDDPKQYSYPPASVTGLGRANIPGHPVFYGGDNPRTAAKEIGANIGDELYMATWKHPGPINYVQFCFDVGTEQRVRRETENAEKVIQNKIPPDRQNVVTASLKEIMNIFLKDEHNISSALAFDVIYEKNFDAIEYACASSRNTFNYALSPSCADEMTLWRVVKLKIDEDFEFEPLEVASLVDGKLQWTSFSPDMAPNDYEPMDVTEFGAMNGDTYLN